MAKFFYSATKQKIMLILATGYVLCFTPSPRAHLHFLKNIHRAWKSIDQVVLRRVIREFKEKRLVDYHEQADGTIEIVLSKFGKQYALHYNPERMAIKKQRQWNRKWHIVVFDIPEKRKQTREAIRWELKKLGFVELQRSVWAFPYECSNAIDFLVELFEVRQHIRYLEVSKISHDADLRLAFNLPAS